MNHISLDERRGCKVQFGKNNNGSRTDREHAIKHLDPNKIYTIESTEIYSFNSYLTLQEVPGKSFNLIMFSYPEKTA